MDIQEYHRSKGHSSDAIWYPSQEWKTNSTLAQFINYINAKYTPHIAHSIDNYEALHRWSITDAEAFWASVWEFFSIHYYKDYDKVFTKHSNFWQCKWFEGAQLNFSENLLYANNRDASLDSKIAIHFKSESGLERSISYEMLYKEVGALHKALSHYGIAAGDRVAGYLPNIPETIIAMLATTSVGAVWASCSCDFGEMGLEDRFLQIKPKVIITVDGYSYKGKKIPILARLQHLLSKLESPPLVVVIPYLHYLNMASPMIDKHTMIATLATQDHDKVTLYEDFVRPYRYTDTSFTHARLAINFVPRDFNDPLYIMFSSGTTGKPKCIVHGIGGTLLQHVKEHCLHGNLTQDDTLFFFTSCGWMMWNWLVSALFVKATIVLFEGNPFYPHNYILLDMIHRYRITHFGAGANYYQNIQKTWEAASPSKLLNQQYDVSSLKVMYSTGSPLSRESFKFIYTHIKDKIQLSSISGGTDILSCFVLGNPLVPVYEGEIQCIGLGMAVEIYDEHQHSVLNKKGDLVCTQPFPSMPIYFYGDHDNMLYTRAYFSVVPQIWVHGDFAKIVPHKINDTTVSKGVVIYGRSDTTLNAGGVRIGTAEIYNVLATINYINEALVVGRTIPNDIEIVLFIVLYEENKENIIHDWDEYEMQIKHTIRTLCTARHVPHRIFVVDDLPRTLSGKISEMSVKRILDGVALDNKEALANPQSLVAFTTIAQDLLK